MQSLPSIQRTESKQTFLRAFNTSEEYSSHGRDAKGPLLQKIWEQKLSTKSTSFILELDRSGFYFLLAHHIFQQLHSICFGGKCFPYFLVFCTAENTSQRKNVLSDQLKTNPINGKPFSTFKGKKCFPKHHILNKLSTI